MFCKYEYDLSLHFLDNVFKSFIVFFFTFRHIIHLELIFTSCGVRMKVNIFAYGPPVVPIPFIKRLSFPH